MKNDVGKSVPGILIIDNLFNNLQCITMNDRYIDNSREIVIKDDPSITGEYLRYTAMLPSGDIIREFYGQAIVLSKSLKMLSIASQKANYLL